MTERTATATASATKRPFKGALKIHGKFYDVTDFAHPGGPVMLSLGQGRDATALFESHHPFTSRAKLESLLKKYETTRPCALLDETDTGEEYEWPQYETKSGEPDRAPVSDFAHETVAKVRAYFEAEAKRRGVSFLEATKATPLRKLELLCYTALFLATLPAVFRGELWTLIVMPLVYWVMGVNMFHDGSHFGLSRDWRVNAAATYVGFYFSAPLEWYHQHVIGHHVYSNIPNKDPDLYHNATMERHTQSLRWRPAHKHQNYTWLPIWWIGTFAMQYLKPIQMFLSGKYNRSVAMMRLSPTRTVIHWLGRALVYSMCHVLPFFLFPAWKAVLFAVVPVGIVSLCFMLSSQVNHLSMENIDVRSTDFYKHQVITSHTFAHKNYLTFMFTGGLNYQIEHHLFPCINHCHLRAIQPIVKAMCEKHNVPYHYSPSLWAAFKKYLYHLEVLAVKPADDKKAQ